MSKSFLSGRMKGGLVEGKLSLSGGVKTRFWCAGINIIIFVTLKAPNNSG